MSKDIPYVASGKEIDYRIPKGLVAMLANASKKSEKDIWLILSELSNVCVTRLKAKEDKGSRYAGSWTKKTFPDTNIELRFSANLYTRRDEKGEYTKKVYGIEISVAGYKFEKFTQKQIDEYIIEGILLGDGEEDDVVTSN